MSTVLQSTINAIGITSFIYVYIAFKLSDEHFLLKIMLIFFSLINLMLLPNALINNASLSATFLSFLKTTLWFFRLFVIYFFIFISWDWAKRSTLLKKLW